jgi:hypothetical protein
MEVFNNNDRFLLLTGPRKCGKTIAACHKILRHCFDTPPSESESGARVAMFTKTTKNAKAGGVWIDLTKIALPKWLKANIGMTLVESPRVTGDTRMSYFKVRNRYGGVAEVQLHSLDYCPEIVEKIKGGRFSMVYFCELDNFDDRIVFDISEDQLRIIGLPWEMHQWIGDTNPPETGPNNWMHDLWFKEKEQHNHPDPEYQEQIQRIEFVLDDNPFLDEREKRTLIAKYRHRKSLYNRFILGLWEEDLTDGCFSEVFREDLHVLGNVNFPDKKDWEIIVPSDGCYELMLGLDLGETNHAASIVEKCPTFSGEPVWRVLDEVVSTDKKVSIREFTYALMERMAFWESYVKMMHNRELRWKTWSDNSIYRYRSAAEVDEALIVRNISGGKIRPISTRKFPGSVIVRKETLYRLLYEKRIYISALCPDTISMLKALKPGTTKLEPIKRSRHKHPFDSLTYILLGEEPMSLEENGPKLDKGSPGLVLVG